VACVFNIASVSVCLPPVACVFNIASVSVCQTLAILNTQATGGRQT
jgi:hypothetical protein